MVAPSRSAVMASSLLRCSRNAPMRGLMWTITDARVTYVAGNVLDADDFRLIAALQHDPRSSTEKIAAALGLDPRRVRRRLGALLGTGIVSIAVTAPRASLQGVMLLRIRVLRGKIDVIT